MHPIVTDLENHMLAASNSTYAVAMEKYMKNKFVFYGINAPERKQITKETLSKYTIQCTKELLQIIQVLWEWPEREMQYIAVDILNKHKKLYPKDFLPFLHYLISTKSWWDTVDLIASNALCNYINRNIKLQHTIISEWLYSNNFWLQRSCIIHQLKYKDKVNTSVLTTCIEHTISDKEFFIRKAIGWSLRQYGKYNPTWVMDFIDNHPNLSKLSVTEAIKGLKI